MRAEQSLAARSGRSPPPGCEVSSLRGAGVSPGPSDPETSFVFVLFSLRVKSSENP
jgi:hypothetical protein